MGQTEQSPREGGGGGVAAHGAGGPQSCRSRLKTGLYHLPTTVA